MDRYALVIGISEYTSGLNKLSKPETDAIAVAERLRSAGWHVQCLKGYVTYDNLETSLREFLERQVVRQDALIYFTGHGFTVEESKYEKRGYLATSDCEIAYKDRAIITQKRGLSFSHLNGLIQDANLSSLVVLLDCCHSGLFVDDGLMKQIFKTHPDQNFCWIASCRAFQESHALKVDSHSLFTGALLEGLSIEYSESGKVTVLSVFRHLSSTFKTLHLQEPIYIGAGKDIPLISYEQTIMMHTVSENCPYQGLFAFTPETKQFFFGRERVVDDLLLKLQRSSFVPLIGPSGSGKSSVVRAGLAPRVTDLGWRVLGPMKPGTEPIYELKRLFNSVFDRWQLPEIDRIIDSEGISGVLPKLEGQKYLLIVDQFEEVFTLVNERGKQRQFIKMLTDIKPESSLAIVMTMRSDFVDAWQAHSDLVKVLQDHAVWIPPLEGQDLIEAITRPAEVQGYRFESGLLESILDDVQEEENCLPLLEFAMEVLWSKRDSKRHRLTLNAYREMGRLMGALNQYATTWYENLDGLQKDWVRRIMLQLVRIGLETKDIRQRQKQKKLIKLGSGSEAIVNLLIDTRLVVAEQGEIDLAHERLMDGWKYFSEWRSENRDLRRLAQRVRDAEKEWRENSQSVSYLMPRGLMMEVRNQWEALELQKILESDLVAYFQDSEAEQQNEIRRMECALTTTELREQVRKIMALQEIRPIEGVMGAIQSAGRSLRELDIVIPEVKGALLGALALRERYFLQGHTGGVWSVAFSPDGEMIVSGSDDLSLRLWDRSGNSIGEAFQGHTGRVWSAVFSPDGEMIVSGSADKTLRLWDRTGNPIGEALQGHTGRVWSVAFSPDGEMIVSGSDDNTLRLWDRAGNSIGEALQGHTGRVMSVAFSPDGEMIVSSSDDKTLRLWSKLGTPLGHPLQGHLGLIRSVAFSPSGELIVSGSDDRTLRLWDKFGNSVSGSIEGHTGSVWSVAFSPDGETIVSGSDDQTIRLWDKTGNAIGRPLLGHTGRVLSVSFSPNSQTIASGSDDCTVRLWDKSGNLTSDPFQVHSKNISFIAFSPDGETIVSGSDDQTIRLWDKTGNAIGEPLQGHTDRVTSIAFSPDGETIVSGSNDQTIRLWDKTGNAIGEPLQGHTDRVTSIAFSPDGETIVSGSDDQTIRLWDKTGNAIGEPLQGHTDRVTSIAFSPDGETIVSGSDDQTIRLWIGGIWEEWLEICCNRLRYHPALNDQTNPLAVEACKICKLYVWDID
jgi:WD40 repeat protein